MRPEQAGRHLWLSQGFVPQGKRQQPRSAPSPWLLQGNMGLTGQIFLFLEKGEANQLFCMSATNLIISKLSWACTVQAK